MEGGREQRSTRFYLSLRFRTFIVGTLELMFGVCLLAFHLLYLLRFIETQQLLGRISRFLPDDEKISRQAYHVVSSILATIMISLSLILFWGVYNNKQDWIWAWILANSTLGVIYAFLSLYGFMQRYIWYMIENIFMIPCIMIFIVVVCPYYKWLSERNYQSRNVANAKASTSNKGPK